MFQQIMLLISNFFQILGLQPGISKNFLITRTIFSHSRSENFFVTKYHLLKLLQLFIPTTLICLINKESRLLFFKRLPPLLAQPSSSRFINLLQSSPSHRFYFVIYKFFNSSFIPFSSAIR